jgi:hypothetical protein
MRKTIFICLLVFLFSSGVSAQTKDTQWLNGIWEGTGYQTDDNSTWAMKLTVRGGRYEIEYPSLQCSGKWIPLSLGPSHGIFRERISEGIDACVDRGRVIIQRLSRRQLAYRFSNPGSRVFTASAILNKRAAVH